MTTMLFTVPLHGGGGGGGGGAAPAPAPEAPHVEAPAPAPEAPHIQNPPQLRPLRQNHSTIIIQLLRRRLKFHSRHHQFNLIPASTHFCQVVLSGFPPVHELGFSLGRNGFRINCSRADCTLHEPGAYKSARLIARFGMSFPEVDEVGDCAGVGWLGLVDCRLGC